MSQSTQTDRNPDCDLQRIQRFLQSDHFRIEDDELIAHLDGCSVCRQELEAQAGDVELWNRATTLLKPSEFDSAGSAMYSAASVLGPASQLPVTIQEALDVLAPTDDPHHLGRIGTYEVTGVVGVGGMGVVLKAIDPSLDRVVAVKLMAPRLANNEAARKRFAREAKAAAAVLHPNVIPIHSVSSDSTVPYLVMAYIRGCSLQKRIEKEAPLPLVEILRIGAQVAAGLAAAHEQGLVHRDIKPENILLEDGVERVTITDFGLARAVDDNTVTQFGVIAGTPMYMSPEQARGEQVDQKSDLFSMGSVLYALCTGRPPYRADSSYGVMRRIIDESPIPICELNPQIPEWFARIVARLMARDKADRFASASEVHKLLEACLSHVQQPEAIPLPAIPGTTPIQKRNSFLKTRTGILTMLTVTSAAVLVAAFCAQPERPSLTITGSGGSSANRSAMPTATDPRNAASLIVEKHESEGSDQSEITHRWKLKGNSVGKVVIRVLHIEDGKTHIQGESVYQSGSEKDGRIEVELHLINSKEPLPSAGKVILPTLAVSAAGLQAKTQAAEKIFFPSDFSAVSFTREGQLDPECHILLHGAYMQGNVEYRPTLKSMIEASKTGASFLATTLDWQSVAQLSANENDDYKNIQGTWRVTYSEDGGRIAPQEMLKDINLVFTKDKMTTQIGGRNSEGTFKLDPTTSPKSIDMTQNRMTKKGIYDLQGDTLRLCFAEQSKERPTKFDSKPDSANDLIIMMKRVIDSASAPLPQRPTTAQEAPRTIP